jgi:hypothetical protein
MANKKNLTRAEAMEIFHQDGVLEIVLGATLLNFGFDVLNGMTFTSLFTYVPIVLMSSMKNQITISRLGYESFDADETSVRNWNLFTAIGIVAILIALSVFVLNDMLNVRPLIPFAASGDLPALFTGIILAISMLAAALLIPLKRFFLYASAAIGLGILGFFVFPAQVIAFVFAGIILGNGIRLMVKFSKKYPLKKAEKNDQGDKKQK